MRTDTYKYTHINAPIDKTNAQYPPDSRHQNLPDDAKTAQVGPNMGPRRRVVLAPAVSVDAKTFVIFKIESPCWRLASGWGCLK